MFVVLLLVVTALGQEDTQPKPFGLGVGPTFIGGRDTNHEGTEVALRIYGQYINYRILTKKATQEERDYHTNFYSKNKCLGKCPRYTYCQNGVCICDEKQSMTQIYGRCFENSTAYWVGDNVKYRKPEPPPLPSYCWRTMRNGGKEKDPRFREDPECQEITIANHFDHNRQFCEPGGHRICHAKDINMFCTENTAAAAGYVIPEGTDQSFTHLCACKQDMKFDTRNMECRIYLDVSCTSVTKDGFTDKGEITSVLWGNKTSLDAQLTEAEMRQAFCLLLEDQVDEYNANVIGAFSWSILGIGAGAFFALVCGGICTACCCCKCCEKVKAKIRAMDPRTHINAMTREQQMAALGTVVAGEYLDRKGEREDAARIQAMQGGVPGGAPPPGYAPVPTGYTPAAQGYGQQPAGGYIPPEKQGMLGDVINMAPELALAGAGAYTGNTTMAGLGVIAAAEKFDGQEDKEDRIRAAAMRGVPPPPMGYAGGPPVPPGQPPQMMQLPPATANYPRQQMN